MIILCFSDFDTDFDTKLPNRQLKQIVKSMKKGFSGARMNTLRKNLHALVRPQILKARRFRKLEDGRYEISNSDCKDSVKLTLGTDITCDDLMPLKIKKSDILREIKKIPVNKENVRMENAIKKYMKKNF